MHRGEEASGKSVHHAHNGEGVDTSRYGHKKSLFAYILLYFHLKGSFIMLSLAMTFITVL